MKTYIYTHKNKSAVIIISAENDKEAFKELMSVVSGSEVTDFRLGNIETDD